MEKNSGLFYRFFASDDEKKKIEDNDIQSNEIKQITEEKIVLKKPKENSEISAKTSSNQDSENIDFNQNYSGKKDNKDLRISEKKIFKNQEKY